MYKDKDGNEITKEAYLALDADKQGEYTEVAEEEISPLDMPDDEFDNITLSDLDDKEEDDSDKDDNSDESKDDDDNSDDDDSDKNTDDKSDDDAKDDDKSDDGDDTSKEDDEDDVDKDTSKDDTSKEDKDKKDTSDKDVTAQGQLDTLFTPFRANGKDMQIDNVEDARKLMQMGANYNKKMAGIKPAMKLVKMLENNDLLDEGKLTYLIDLSKKNPDAIRKLVKDSGISIDTDVDDTDNKSEYKPGTYTVDDSSIDIDNVIDELRDSPAFKRTMDVVGNKLDEPSKEVLVKSPGIIRVINEHIELGVYDKIMTIVERERMLGKLNGLNDLEAYKLVGDAVNAKGGFKDAKKDTDKTDNKDSDNDDKSIKDKERKDRKKSASSTKGSSNKKPVKESYNPLDMPDDEFDKIATSKYA